jgi:hypothetical protein
MNSLIVVGYSKRSQRRGPQRSMNGGILLLYVDARSVERIEGFSAACQSSGFDLEEAFVSRIPIDETELSLAVRRQRWCAFQ